MGTSISTGWGSLQAQDSQVRAQRLIQTLGIIAKLAPVVQGDLLTQGKKIDWEYMFRRVWREGLGERGAGTFIRQMTPQEMQVVQQMMQQKQQMEMAKIQGKGGGSGDSGPRPGMTPDPEALATRQMSNDTTGA